MNNDKTGDGFLASKWVDSDTCKIIHNSNGKIGWVVKSSDNEGEKK